MKKIIQDIYNFYVGKFKYDYMSRIYKFFIKFIVKKMGKNSRIHYSVELFSPEGLEIGDFVTINHHVIIEAKEGVKIGNYCRISGSVRILTRYLDIKSFPRKHLGKPVVIEDNVWIGVNAIILPGVKIGANSVIGAGSIVTRDIPPNVLAAGVPARVIKEIVN